MNSENYFESYDNISVHNLMLRDAPRVEKYKEAILNSKNLFQDKIVLDVGSGTGILSMFCVQAGAKHVFAVEACKGICELSRALIRSNNMSDRITLINNEIEKIELDVEKVDIIVSEWMGMYLVHESMLNSVLYARDKWLKEDGLMYPSCAYLYVAPVQMSSYLEENLTYWKQYHGLSFEPMTRIYRELLLEKPLIETIAPDNLIDEQKILTSFDLKTVRAKDLESIQAYDIDFMSTKNAHLHGFAFWFDVVFHTDNDVVTLSTSPQSRPTHWKQTIAFLPEALDNSNEIPELKEYDKFGCYVIMNQSDDNTRHYVIDIGVNFESADQAKQTEVEVVTTENNTSSKEVKNSEKVESTENIYDSDDDEDYDDDSYEDDDGAEHPMPCDCKRIKCILIKATLAKYDSEKSSDVAI